MVFSITLHRMIIFFLIFAVGFAVGKKGLVKQDFMPGFAQLITKILLPVMIFYMTYTSTTRAMLAENYFVLLLAAVAYVVLAAVTWVLARCLRLGPDRGRAFQFCFIFGNTGFVGMPLLAAVFPEYGLLFMGLFTVVDQLVFWTYGIYLATAQCNPDGTPIEREGGRRFNPKALLTPNIMAIVVVLVFVAVQIPLPGVVTDTLGVIAGGTPAMCMIYLGLMASFANWLPALKTRELYVGAVVKMIVLPIIAAKVLFALGLPHDAVACMTLVIALPVMTVVPMIAKQYGNEGEFAAGITVATLVMCVVTIPLVAFLAL